MHKYLFVSSSVHGFHHLELHQHHLLDHLLDHLQHHLFDHHHQQ